MPEKQNVASEADPLAVAQVVAQVVDTATGGGLSAAEFDIVGDQVDQAPLFDSSELVIPDTLRFLRKGVAAIHATPARGQDSRSLNGHRLFDACILIAQMHVKGFDAAKRARMREDRISPLFETRITDLARLAGIPGKNYVRVYEELRQLREMVLRWNIVGEDAEVQWEMEASFLSMFGVGKGAKRGAIRFSIDPSVLDIVLEPRNWATLSLQALRGLGTAAGYALYQNTWRYLNTHAKVTAPLPLETWVELLVGKSRYVVDEPGKGKRAVNYADFKRRVLVDAMRRVNEQAALGYTLELKEIRAGNRVTRLQFKFLPKSTAALPFPLAWPDELLQYLRGLGFDKSEIADLAQAHSYELVVESVERMRKGLTRLAAAGQQVSSRKAYFLGIVANVAGGVALEAIDDAQVEAEARARAAQLAAEERHRRLEQAWQAHVARRFAEELFAMPDGDREGLLTEFASSTAGAQVAGYVKDGWRPTKSMPLAVLRVWLKEQRPEWHAKLLPNPEDQTLEAWKDWRLDQGGDR